MKPYKAVKPLNSLGHRTDIGQETRTPGGGDEVKAVTVDAVKLSSLLWCQRRLEEVDFVSEPHTCCKEHREHLPDEDHLALTVLRL